MKFVFASDSFKGTLSSARIGALLAESAHEVFPDASCAVCPIADGGEGTLDAIAAACDGRRLAVPAHDGLLRPIDADILVVGDTAVVEAASTCGLALLDEAERNPLQTTSFGVGECIRAALDQGCRDVLVGLGGSCTNDGGMGCLRALGVRFLDAAGNELAGCGADLAAVARVDESGLHPRAKQVPITVLGDVDNPLLGPAGATRVFGWQKGADAAAIEQLEAGMAHFAQACTALHPEADVDTPGFGAAGGLGMALSVFLGACIRSGVEELLALVGFDELLEGADLVVTGEGRLDGQSLHGKAIGGIVAHAQRAGVPVAAICGTVALDAGARGTLGLAQLIDASQGQTLEHALLHAERNYRRAARKLFLSVKLGIRPAVESDLGRILEIYAAARDFMARTGNPNQWGPTNWPPEALLRNDIAQHKSYVCEREGRVVGVFFYDFGPDIEPTYAQIEDGAWLDESPYGVIRRLASDGSVPGVGRACIEWALSLDGHLRIDTHGDNLVMQRLVEKLGFAHCGTIYVEEDDYPRRAYEKSVEGGRILRF